MIRPGRPNIYTGSPLDRCAEKRDDSEWVLARLSDPESLFVPVWRTRSLIAGVGPDGAVLAGAEPQAAMLSGRLLQDLRAPRGPWAFLGLWRERAVFAHDLSAEEAPERLLPEGLGAFVDLRGLGSLMPREEASILAHARGVMHWQGRHGFCGACGARCEAASAGHVMKCTGCGASHFPRTDPAVIMLVTRGDRAILGHSHRFPLVKMYSTLAGFVEPGESLEEAVAREVFEEVGVRVGDVRYHSSQPWPFPASLMLGFYADALTEEINFDAAELKDARWFSQEQIRNHEALEFRLPRVDSIARRLIEDWLAAG